MTRKLTRLGIPLFAIAIFCVVGGVSWKAYRFQESLASPAPFHTHRRAEWVARHPAEPDAPVGPAATGSAGTAHVSFVDVSQKSGLHYRWTISGPHPLDILQTIGNGCAFLDYNNDGNLDILLVGPKLALYKGDGKGHFTDVTHLLGLDKFTGHFLGCAVGDYDNDGYDDVYISGYRTGLLLHNDGGKKFTDVTQKAGLSPQPWGTTCAWADIDNDGLLDLFIGNYVRFDVNKNKRLCDSNGRLRGCGPVDFAAEHGKLYRNSGGGRFRDVTAQWIPETMGKVLGAAFADYDQTGRPSLYLANDEEPGDLLENTGTKFINRGRESGTAFDGHFRIHGGMGMDWGDYDNDGRFDMMVTAYQGEPKCIFHNEGNDLFFERSDVLALSHATTANVAFGAKWLDYDNDGWLDLMLTNGHVYDDAVKATDGNFYRQATQLFHNDQGHLFVDVSNAAGKALQHPIVGRGLAVGDYDNDGRMDALVVDSEGTPLLLHNESALVGHWLTLSLEGNKSNRDGYGAVVTAQIAGRIQTLFCHSDGSYLSASDKRVHIGLGTARSIAVLKVRWPDGHADVFHNVPGDRFVTLREGEAQLRQTNTSRR